MNKGIMLIGTILLTAVSASADNPKKWTLEECINYAMTNNITLKKTRLEKQSATEDLKQSKAALLPSFNLSTNQSIGYRPWVNDGVSTVNNGTVSTSINKTSYNGSYGLNTSWTVWNGNRNLNTVKQNRLAEQQAELNSDITANSIQEQIIQLYVQILYLKEAINVCRNNYETALKNEERGKEMVEAGNMSKADLAQLTAQTATDKYNITEAESNLAGYRLQLKQLLEITGEEDFDIYIPEISDNKAMKEIPPLETGYETALTTRPEIENGRLAIENSKLGISIAKSGKMPTISLTGGVGTNTTSMNSRTWGTQIKTNMDASVGATLSIPLFDNRSTRTAVNKAKLQQEESLLDLQDRQKQLYSTIEGYWLDAYTNQQKFKAAQASVESEQAGYDLVSEQFRLGMKNIIELMTGKNNLLNAQQNRLQSKYMTILNIQILNFYKGEPAKL